MLVTLDKQRTPLRNTVTLAGAIEAFLDPTIAVTSLFVVLLCVDAEMDASHVILALITFSLTFPGNISLNDIPRRIARKCFVNSFMLIGILCVFGIASGYISFFQQDMLLGWFVSLPFALTATHLLARAAIPRILALSESESRAVICGVNDIGAQLARQFQSNRYLGVQFVGYFDDRARERLHQIGDAALLGKLKTLAEYVKLHSVDRIYLALPMATQPRILQLLDDLKDTTASIYFVPDIFVTDLIQGRLESVGGMPVVGVCDTPFAGINGLVKRVSDVILSILIMILISPVLLGVAIAVRLSSPGPIIFKQRRYGLDGKEIVVYKFRSMTVTEDGDKVVQARKNDQRITKVGAFIRKTSLDELPQFMNVLQGRMSIVGPRPHAVSHNETYRKIIKGYMVRHKVKPGITGWAQVNGYRGETETVDKMEKRIEFDLEYLRNWSLGLDFWIIIKTALVFLKHESAY